MTPYTQVIKTKVPSLIHGWNFQILAVFVFLLAKTFKLFDYPILILSVPMIVIPEKHRRR